MHLSIAIIPLFSADHCNCIFTPLHKICCKFQIDIKDHKNLFLFNLTPFPTSHPPPPSCCFPFAFKFKVPLFTQPRHNSIFY